MTDTPSPEVTAAGRLMQGRYNEFAAEKNAGSHRNGFGWPLYDEGTEWIALINAPANARRLAACWNACDKIPTDVLEEADGFTEPLAIASKGWQKFLDDKSAELTSARERIAVLTDGMTVAQRVIHSEFCSSRHHEYCEDATAVIAGMQKRP